MPFAVFSQTGVKVDWKKVNSLSESVGKWEKRMVGDDHTRGKVLAMISKETGVSLDDLALQKEVYYLNDKQEVSFHYTDRDNACLVIDLQLRPKIGMRVRWIGDGPYARTYPYYSVEKVQ